MTKRNIIVFLCDQLRPDFLEIYGCNAVPTPNINRLAEKGVVFDQAITQSTVCAPARASMMTGRYVSDHQVWTNDVPFRKGMEYLAERMNELDYKTAAFGKMHHYPALDTKGFQHISFMEEGRLGQDEPYFKWLKKRHPAVENVWNYEDMKFKYSEDEYHEHWIASEAIKYIKNHVSSKEEQPFLSWISFQGPHSPFDPPQEVKGIINKEELPQPIISEEELAPVAEYRKALNNIPEDIDEIMKMRVSYAEMIVEIDRQIGRILDLLKEHDFLEETTVIFSADHGDLLGDYGLNAKGPYPYQGQLAIPMVISNHPDIEAGRRSDSLVGNIDIPGTVLDIADADRGIGVSRSLIDLAQEKPENPRQVNFSEFCDSIKTVENKRYRYSHYPFQDKGQLFDKKEDPQQLHNLVGSEGYNDIEQEFLKHIIDFGIVSKGVRVEAHDFIPEQQSGAHQKHPGLAEDFKVAFPLSSNDQEKLEGAGLDTDYNEICKRKEILSNYSLPYWIGENQE